MISQNHHIISRCFWQTSFDNKEGGEMVQNEISNWSEHYMPREMNAVFNWVCSQYHSLQIKSLTIDLGEIPIENLKEELTYKFRIKLQEQLRELILNPNRYEKEVAILKGEETWMFVLHHFLMQGIVPWNYSESSGNINQIVSTQLQENREAVIEMIRNVATEELARKRIAWQLRETHIKQIITHLEKGNYNYIIEFSKEFTKLQERQTLVKTGIQDFKKNLWFWILNYLFVERGSMFNKVEFVRSNIQQMANHFNMEYNELFTLIENAVDKLHQQSYIKSNFITILTILAHKQSKIISNTYASKKQLERNWRLLHYYFSSAKNRETTYHKEQFRVLVQTLSILNPSQFNRIINSVTNTTINWQMISKDLQVDNFKILLENQSEEATKKIIELVSQLKFLELQKHFGFDENWLMSIGFQFLKQYKGQTFSNKKFFNYFIEKLSKTKSNSRQEVLEKIINLNLSSSKKSTEAITVFKEFKQIYTTTVLQTVPKFSKKKLVIILKDLQEVLQTTNQNLLAEKYYKIIRIWIQEHAQEVWNALKTYKDKGFIIKIVSVLFKTATVKESILKKVVSKELQFLKKLETSIDKVLEQKKEVSQALHEFKNQLFVEGASMLIFKDAKSTSTLVKKLFAQLLAKYDANYAIAIKETLQDIISHFQVTHHGFSSIQQKELNVFIQTFSENTSLDFLMEYIEKDPYKQEEVAAILQELVYSKNIVSPSFKKHEHKIANYLLKNAPTVFELFQQEFIKTYQFILQGDLVSQIKKKLDIFYWQCLADYTSYRGDKSKFLVQLLEAITYEFDLTIPESIAEKDVNFYVKEKVVTKHYKTSMLYYLPSEEIINSIKKAIQEGKTNLQIQERTIELQKLIQIVLRQYPQEIRQLFQKTSFTRSEKICIQTIISFEELVTRIAKDKMSSSFNSTTKAIHILYNLVTEIGGKQTEEKLKELFWSSLWEVIKNEQTKKEEVKRLTIYVLEKLYQQGGITIQYIFEKLEDKNSSIPVILKQVLVEQSTIFQLLKAPKKVEPKKALHICESKGHLTELAHDLLISNKIPSWYTQEKPTSVKQLLHDVLQMYPLTIVTVLRRESAGAKTIQKLIAFTDIVEIVKQVHPEKQLVLDGIQKLYKAISNSFNRKISSKEIQQILYEKLLQCWQKDQWRPLEVIHFWKELLWELSAKRSLEEAHFFEVFDDIKIQLPNAMQLAFNALKKERNQYKKREVEAQYQKLQQLTMNENKIVSEGIKVPNAGMVLLDSYYPILFERLGLTSNTKFVSKEAQLDAVHYLQYVVTGQTQTEEQLLALNKLCCGLSFEQPVKEGIQLSNENRQLIDGMIQSAISYWDAIGKTTVGGFRGNWLVREGVLTEEEDRWNLTVEKRPYDVLLEKSPFTFSIIKYPWMSKPLHVTWPY